MSGTTRESYRRACTIAANTIGHRARTRRMKALVIAAFLTVSFAAMGGSVDKKHVWDWRAAGNCKALVTGNDAYCKTGDCKAIVNHNDAYCSSSDCKAVVNKNDAYCKAGDCKAIVTGNDAYCP